MPNKKYIIAFVLAAFLVAGASIYAAPIFNVQRSLIPEIDNRFFVGSTSPAVRWGGLYVGNTASSTILGNLGIGTTTAPTVLSVQGVGNFGPATSTLYSGLVVPSLTATSGIAITGGCYLTPDGTCLTASALSGSGASGRVTFWSGASALSSNSIFTWDNTNARLGVGTTTPGVVLGVTGAGIFTEQLYARNFTATSASHISTFPVASTTSFSVTNLLTVAGAGTSTYTGGVSTAGLLSSNGLTISVGDALFAGLIKVSSAGTSTYVGGLSSAGLTSTIGLNVTGDALLSGLIKNSNTGTSTFDGGVSVAGLNATTNGLRVTGGIVAGGGMRLTGTLDVSGAVVFPGGLTLTCTGCITDTNAADNLTLTNITQITNRAISDTTGTLTVSRGGTGVTIFGNNALLVGQGTGVLISTSSPEVGWINATSTTNASTFTTLRTYTASSSIGVATSSPATGSLEVKGDIFFKGNPIPNG